MLRARANQAAPGRELAAVLAASRNAFIGVGVMSGVLNVLMLTGSFYMLEIYDRVLPSRSVPTLVALSAIVLVLYAFQGLIDLIRSRILARVGASFDETLSHRVYENIVRLPLKSRSTGDGLQPLRDLDQVRGFLSSPGPTALFDVPWIPLYLFICFAFHFWIGMTALAGALILVVLTILTEIFTREPTRAAVTFGVARNSLAESSRRNAEVLRAMGMGGRIGELWGRSNAKFLTAQQQAADVAGGLGAASKILRMILQSAVLAVGAYLVIQQQATGGIIIASSILTSRALAPIELAIAHWRGFISARQSWRRLSDLLATLPPQYRPMPLPAPTASLSVESASVIVPGGQRLVVQDVSFALKAGNGLGIIGASASGKSSLARMIVGVWTPARGKVRVDGAALEQWDPEALGRHIGYLPQDVELFAGTVAQNIARFDPDAKPDVVIAAAKAAGVNDMILRLPEGYESEIGEGGTALSAGQRQRLALARALYDDPFLVVLDEPNSNLDAEGEQALTQAILGVRARGGVAIVIAHRPSALAGVDLVLMMAEGKAQAFGPKDEVLNKVLRRSQSPQPVVPLKVATEAR